MESTSAHLQDGSSGAETANDAPVVGIIDYGAGNLRNVNRAFQHLGARTIISDSPGELERASRLVLPGVGAFKPAMESLRHCGLSDWISKQAARGIPLLGLCLGCQMLFDRSEEFGNSEGLGLLAGRVRKFGGGDLQVPHMGWNEVAFAREHPLAEGLGESSYFYFANSFYVEPADPGVVIGTTEYGVRFSSIVGKANVLGAQFHPEKSHNAGMRMLGNFVRMRGL